MPTLPRVLVTLRMPLEHLAPLDGIAEIDMSPHEYRLMTSEEVGRALPGCAAILSQGELRVDEALLALEPGLRIVANAAMGYDNLDIPALTRRGIWATNTPDAFVESSADLTLGLLLSLVRNIVTGDHHVRAGEWSSQGFQPVRWEGMLLGGKTLGMVGYGRIAQAVEKRALAFGMRVIHTRAHPRADPGPNHRSLSELLAESDVVSLHVPLNPATRHLINADTLGQMRPGAILLNVSRGSVVDEPALISTLRSGRLAGAGLDVFEREPHASPELFPMSNVVLTPHLGGSTREDRAGGRRLAAENVAAVLRGGIPPNALNSVPLRADG